MDLNEECVFRIAESVWSQILGAELRLGPAPRAAGRERTLCGSVQIEGEWEGVVNLHCSALVAERAATTMFGLVGQQRPADDQIGDALGELANMIGGNLKGLLPDSCRLSLPTVVDGEAFAVHVLGRTEELLRVPMTSGGEPVVVSVLRKRA